MKRFSKVLFALLVVALSLPIVCNADTAMAKKAEKEKKLTVEQVMARMQEATNQQNDVTVVADTKVECSVLGKPVSVNQTQTEEVLIDGEDSVKVKVVVVQKTDIDQSLLDAMGDKESAASTETEVLTYVSVDETGISVYVKEEGKWVKVILPMDKIMAAITGENQMGAAKKNDNPMKFTMKESKKKYTITGKMKFTESMLSEITDALEGVEGAEEVADYISLAASNKAMKFTYVVDKKTMLLTGMKADLTAYTDDVVSNVIDFLAKKDSSVALMKGNISVKACQVKASIKYGKIKSIEVPAEAENGEDLSEEVLKAISEYSKVIIEQMQKMQ